MVRGITDGGLDHSRQGLICTTNRLYSFLNCSIFASGFSVSNSFFFSSLISSKYPLLSLLKSMILWFFATICSFRISICFFNSSISQLFMSNILLNSSFLNCFSSSISFLLPMLCFRSQISEDDSQIWEFLESRKFQRSQSLVWQFLICSLYRLMMSEQEESYWWRPSSMMSSVFQDWIWWSSSAILQFQSFSTIILSLCQQRLCSKSSFFYFNPLFSNYFFSNSSSNFLISSQLASCQLPIQGSCFIRVSTKDIRIYWSSCLRLRMSTTYFEWSTLNAIANINWKIWDILEEVRDQGLEGRAEKGRGVLRVVELYQDMRWMIQEALAGQLSSASKNSGSMSSRRYLKASRQSPGERGSGNYVLVIFSVHRIRD